MCLAKSVNGVLDALAGESELVSCLDKPHNPTLLVLFPV